MTIKQALKKAEQNGFSRSKIDNTSIDHFYLLDPLFWERLGKAMGWEDLKGEELKHFRDDDNFRFYHHEIDGRMWLYEWHRFIDHLAEGKSAEDFFKELK